MQLSANNHPFLAKIDELCVLFAERAADVDTGGAANALFLDNIAQIGRTGFYGAAIPEQLGGLGLPEPARREAVERLAAACGATAFSQNQLHSGGSFVMGSSDEEIKRELLPKFAAAEILCGVAFAHLRRPGKPAVVARKVEGGYLIDGKAPWISVWSALDAFILGATVEGSDEMLFCYVDKHASVQNLDPSEPMQLAVMTASDTISFGIRDLFVAEKYVLQRHDAEHMKRSDYCGITSHVTLPLGCARGSVAFLKSLEKTPATEAADRLQNEIDICREESIAWNGSRADDPFYRENALRARAGAVNLALRAAETAIAASGGRAHLLTHPAQRRLREAGFYATMALTTDTQSALMETFTHAC